METARIRQVQPSNAQPIGSSLQPRRGKRFAPLLEAGSIATTRSLLFS